MTGSHRKLILTVVTITWMCTPAIALGAPHVTHVDGSRLSVAWAIPFAGMLLSIAIFPLIAPRQWHHHYGKVALFWVLLFLSLFTIHFGVSTSAYYILEVCLLEFIPFIALLLALFTVSGGIHIRGNLAGTPKVNTGFLVLGTFLASWMGTTGAAMLLIRPLLNANAWRVRKTHIVVFFIFLVANIGGSLTPLGDPPLFLGFLRGVGFFWTTGHLLKEMLIATAMLIAIFYAIDTIHYRREKGEPGRDPAGISIGVDGKVNFILLGGVICAVLASSIDMGSAFTIHHVTMPIAALVQVGALLCITLLSLHVTDKRIRERNEFTWEPIKEVAKLFAAIFITMVMPIAMLKAGADGPMGTVISSLVDADGNFINARFFWATGILSSFLDNAPTYLVFFETAGGNAAQLMTSHSDTLIAISCGAVFMGANTYIGNAPNFMVKSIAEERGIMMPSFFGYLIKYSIPVLIPVFAILTLLFF